MPNLRKVKKFQKSLNLKDKSPLAFHDRVPEFAIGNIAALSS